MKIKTFDIETAANSNAQEWFNKVKISAPSNYKDPSKIKSYIDAQREKLLVKAPLSWWTGRVISCAIVNNDDLDDISYCFNIDEKELLKEIADKLSDALMLYGKTNKNFDNPFLVGRYMVNRLPIPYVLKSKVNDIDDFFGYFQSGQRGSLDAYLHGLNLESKPMDGSMVPRMFDEYLCNVALDRNHEDQENFLRTLKEYNIFDAVSTAKIANIYRNKGAF